MQLSSARPDRRARDRHGAGDRLRRGRLTSYRSRSGRIRQSAGACRGVFRSSTRPGIRHDRHDRILSNPEKETIGHEEFSHCSASISGSRSFRPAHARPGGPRSVACRRAVHPAGSANSGGACRNSGSRAARHSACLSGVCTPPRSHRRLSLPFPVQHRHARCPHVPAPVVKPDTEPESPLPARIPAAPAQIDVTPAAVAPQAPSAPAIEEPTAAVRAPPACACTDRHDKSGLPAGDRSNLQNSCAGAGGKRPSQSRYIPD